MLTGFGGENTEGRRLLELVLNGLENYKTAQGAFFCQPCAFFFYSGGTTLHSYRFFTALLHYGFFPLQDKV